ncbi:MAG: YicC family protein [Gemmatimonadetes bacterium]|nr:YicC family protein [Gemmatimonadota bacterium]
MDTKAAKAIAYLFCLPIHLVSSQNLPKPMQQSKKEPAQLRSMTGFGHADRVDAEAIVQVEIRGVNHRFCNVNVRAPRELPALDRVVEERVRARVRRGRVDVSVTLSGAAGSSLGIHPDQATRVAEELRGLANRLELSGPLTLDHLLAVPALFSGAELDGDRVSESAMEAIDEALDAFDASRLREGEALARVLGERAGVLEAGLAEVRRIAPERMVRYETRLRERVQLLLGENEVDDARLLQEIATLAEKVDIAEECDRIEAHLIELRGTLEGGGAVGRRIDFLAQELQRECGTIGAKAHSKEMAIQVVRMKEEVERLREQTQNLE